MLSVCGLSSEHQCDWMLISHRFCVCIYIDVSIMLMDGINVLSRFMQPLEYVSCHVFFIVLIRLIRFISSIYGFIMLHLEQNH